MLVFGMSETSVTGSASGPGTKITVLPGLIIHLAYLVHPPKCYEEKGDCEYCLKHNFQGFAEMLLDIAPLPHMHLVSMDLTPKIDNLTLPGIKPISGYYTYLFRAFKKSHRIF